MTQATQDAIADAATLRRQYSVSDFTDVVCAGLHGAGAARNAIEGNEGTAAALAMLAARRAFRAVPELRG